MKLICLQPAQSLLLPTRVKHSACTCLPVYQCWPHCMTGGKKKKAQTLCNQVLSLQYLIYLCSLKGGRRQTPLLPWAAQALICYLDWDFHLWYAVFFGCRQIWIFTTAAILLLMLYVCVLMVCLWINSEWLPCRATVQALLPQRIKPECQAHRENSLSEDQKEDKRVLQLNHYLVTEFNRRQNSVWHIQCI